MALFSERQNLLPKPPLQTNSLDEKSRNMFYNLLDSLFFSQVLTEQREKLRKQLWEEFFVKIKYNRAGFHIFFDAWVYGVEWYLIYDLIEWIHKNYAYSVLLVNCRFTESVEKILIKNNIGYSFIDGNFIPITNETEIQSLQETMSSGFENVESHFNNAVQLFSDRENPDYINCIKECICAVEAMLMIVLGVNKGTVGEMVKNLSNQNKLPEPLKEGWSKMYGYTSNYGGVRHGKRDDDEIEIDFHHAKYFLVISSAFINYLKGIK